MLDKHTHTNTGYNLLSELWQEVLPQNNKTLQQIPCRCFAETTSQLLFT